MSRLSPLAALAFTGLFACSSNTYYYVTPGEDAPRNEALDGDSGVSVQADSGPTPGEPPPQDAGAKDASKPPADAGPTDAGAPAWVGPACARSKPNNASFQFRPPRTGRVCNDRDLAYVNQRIASLTPFRTIQSGLFNATCASCIFSEIGDSTWGPIVFTSTGAAFKNFAGCEVTAGKSLTCGETSARLDYCWRGVCDQCATQTELKECLRASSQDPGSPCRSEFQAVDAACGGVNPVNGCGTLQEAIATMCGSGLP